MVQHRAPANFGVSPATRKREIAEPKSHAYPLGWAMAQLQVVGPVNE